MKTPLPHQIEDAGFLLSGHVRGNFSGTGSGKTLTSLTAVNKKPGLTQIVVPPIALRMWMFEFEEVTGGKAQLVKTGKDKLDPTADAHVMSYDIMMRREIGEYRHMVFDESHALQNITAQRTKLVMGKGGLVNKCDHAHMLTGTPSTRWNDGLFPFLCRACPDKLRAKLGGLSFQKFKLRYCITQRRTFPGARWPVELVVGNRNTEELNEMIYGENPVAVRRELADVWKAMPEFTETVLPVSLEMDDELRAMIKETDRLKPHELQAAVQSKDPALSTLRRKLGIAKVRDSAREIAARVNSGAGAILVGAWHTDVLETLKNDLTSRKHEEGRMIRAEVLDGRTSKKRKAELEDMFNAGQLDALIGQIASMGVSLNLQHGGNRIVVVEEDWSPAIMHQFYARLYRMGQINHVHAEILRGPTKIEAAVARISATKDREHGKLNRQAS